MSKVTNVHDSWLHFLADNLTGITVREMKFDRDDMTSRIIQTDALNVEFTTVDFETPNVATVVFDLAHTDQLTGKEWEYQIAQLLHATAMTEVIDYRTDPTTPAVMPQQMISWNAKIVFRTIVSDTYYHSTATIKLTFS